MRIEGASRALCASAPDRMGQSNSLEELTPRMREAAGRAGWTELMPVQARGIPYLIEGRDVMIQSRTGSGKTGAFVLPILERIDLKRKACQALVLVPTRELARQVEKDAALLAGKAGVSTVAVYGGVRYGAQLKAFKEGAHLVVGTPGRILDHLLRRSLTLQDLQILVFDEADRMLSMGFYPDMRRVQEFLPRRRIHGAMFSATYPPQVLGLAGEFLHEPETLSLSTDHVHVTETEHVFYRVDAMTRDRALMRIIEIENPASAIIFCRRRSRVDYVAVLLQNFGYDADKLSSDLPQNAREQVLDRLRKGELRFLVATDVAARGIDIRELSHVIQYEPPEDPEAYIHRAGRTGRAGATGEALTLVASVEEIEMKEISKRFGFELVERSLPSEEDVAAVVSERVTALLEAELRSRGALNRERMQRFATLAKSLGELDDVMAMLLDDFYHKSLHEPLVPPPPPARPPREQRRRGRRRR
ncbi:MAG: DEAD/DEAH box helicase [Planctomycetota bacterium]